MSVYKTFFQTVINIAIKIPALHVGDDDEKSRCLVKHD